MAHTDDIAHRVAEALASDLSDFRYTRSRTQLRKAASDYTDDMIIDVTSRTGASYSIAFYIGVAHAQTEKLIAELESRKVTPYDRSVFQYSVNQTNLESIGFKGTTWWHGLERDTDLSEILTGIREFVHGCALPYFEHFHELLKIRESLVTRDGLVLNQNPFKQVLAIDALLGDSQHMQNYRNQLQQEVDGGYRHDCRTFNEFHDLIAEKFPGMFSPFELRTKRRA